MYDTLGKSFLVSNPRNVIVRIVMIPNQEKRMEERRGETIYWKGKNLFFAIHKVTVKGFD